MSKSHLKYLPVIARHASSIWSSVHIEAQLNRSGEKMDVFGRAERPINLTMPGCDIELWRGATSVHEYKKTVSDLRSDLDKPWRRHRDAEGKLVRAFGDHRFYWLHRDGDVRPEHVDEDRHHGWGVMLFDEHGFEIVRASHRFAVAFYDTIELVAQLKDQDRNRGYAQLIESTVPAKALANRTRNTPDAEQSGSGGGATAGAGPVPTGGQSGGRVDPLDLVDQYLAEGGAALAQITRWLREEHGIKMSPPKLEGRMVVSRRYVRPPAGGVWELKSDRGAA